MVEAQPIPGPAPMPFIGNLRDVDPELGPLSIAKLIQRYGELIQLNFMGREKLFAGSQRIVHELSDQSRFTKVVTGALEEARNVAGDGLFTAHSTEPSWAVAHRILIPTFGPLSIREMFPGMQDIAEQLITKWLRHGDAKIDVVSDFTKLTLDTIALCTFSYRFNSFYSEEPPAFVNAMARSLKMSGLRARRLPGAGVFYRGQDRQYKEDIELQHRIADEIIQDRIKNPTDHDDLLSKMLKGKDIQTGQGLSPENIRYQLVTFLIAGHETTSGLLSFLFYWLLRTPRAYQAIKSEVDQVCKTEPVKFEHLQKLKYIDAALKETLRLNPTAPGWTVAANEDEAVLDGKYEIKKGQTVLVVLDALHKDPAVWGEDADEFRPERMLDGGFENLPPDSWKPFGNGMRACIGRPFAWQESLLVVAKIFQHFDLRPDNISYELKIKSTLTVKPSGFHMHVTPRKDMLIDPTSSSQAFNSAFKKESAHPDVQDEQTATEGKQKIYIYYGSNAGTCKALAYHMMQAAAAHSCYGKIGVLNELANDGVPKDGPVIIVTASYEGNPTDDAGFFVEKLKSEKSDAFAGVKYAVFGCGHPDWAATFMAIPTLIDDKLSELGGERLQKRGHGDASRADLFDEFDDWEDALWTRLQSVYSEMSAPDPKSGPSERLQVDVDSSKRQNLLHYEFMQSVKVIGNEVIVKGNVPIKRHLVLELPEEASYRSGDYLGLLPTTPVPVVMRVLARFGMHVDDVITLSGVASGGTVPVGRSISAVALFAEYFELEQPATLKHIKKLRDRAEDDATKSALEQYTEPDVYKAEVSDKRISVLALLEKFPELPLSLAEFIEMLPNIKMRQYSISSSPLDNPHHVSLTISVLDAPHLSGSGKRYMGTATTFLAQLEPGSMIYAAVRPSNEGFHPPADPAIPIIMGCAGTGIAPFRSFVQERALQKEAGREVGPALLFYGCHSPDTDLLYDAEMADWQKKGVVQVKHAFSRAPDQSEGCKYVQDRVWHDRAEVEALFRADAKVYVCGSSGMAKSLQQTAVKILAAAKEVSENEAEEMYLKLKSSRFSLDIFG